MGEAYILNRNRLSIVQWRKWNCFHETDGSYTETSRNVGAQYGGDSWYSTNFTIHAYGDYEFSSSSGFTGVDSYGDVLAADAVGYYDVDSETVFSIDSVEETTRNGTDYLLIYKTLVANADYDEDEWYEKGSTDYGVIYARKGRQPEDGTLVSGSVTSSSCVLKIDGKYYYYEKVETN